MTDYSTLKVTDLKAELKRRGIPQTGLRVKQQIIEKLEEDDNKGNGEGTEEAAAAEPEQEPEEQSQPAEPEAPVATEKEEKDDAPTQDSVPPTTDDQAEVKKGDEPADETAQPQKPDDTTEPLPQSPQAEEGPKETQEPEGKDTKAENGVKEPDVDAEATKPVEQAPGGKSEQEPSTSKDEARPTETTPTTAPGAQTSGVNTAVSTPLPSEELIEDVRKRKRRSQSPAPHLEQIARKKAKAADEAAQTSSEEKDTTGADVNEAPKPSESSEPVSKEVEQTGSRDEAQPEKRAPQKQGMRFKELFTSTERDQTQPSGPPVDTEMEDVAVQPALHAATAAIYIDGLMRPLQPAALKNHLLLVASPPGASPNPDLIAEFYLDSIKTHCFARFADVSTASRVRSSLHNTVWPNEKNRKSLFVDFIPEHKVHDWIQMEEAARGRSGPPPRWEVKYDKRDDEIVAVLEEVDLKNAARGPAKHEFAHPPPRGPRAEMQPTDRRPSAQSQPRRPSHPGQGFKPLDELFKSTTAKPKLYYLPVPRDVADKRLDRFDDLIRKGTFPRRGGDETRKFTFEDDDQFVDLGAEFAGRGRGGGRGRGRGGGMMDSRGGRRDRH